jgi:hypothetical protein
MSSRTTIAVTASVSMICLTTVTASPAGAAAPNLPNPCKLLKTAEIVGVLHPSTTQPVISHSTYAAGTPTETKTCTWKFGSLRVVLNTYNKSGGSGGPPTKTTQEPSLGPDGHVTQSASPQFKFTIVSYKRHKHYVDINVNRNVKPKPMVKLGKYAYNRT